MEDHQQWVELSAQELSEIRFYEEAAERALAEAEEERRRAKRLSLQVEVTVTSGDNFFMGFSENLSEGGMFISTMSPPLVGESVSMMIKVGGEEVQVEGVVRWHRFIGDVVTGCGVQFEGLSAEAQRRFEEQLVTLKKEPLFFEM